MFANSVWDKTLGTTAKAREYMNPFPPSSPSIALFKDGDLVHFIERHHIEGRSAQMIVDNLKDLFTQVLEKLLIFSKIESENLHLI